MISPSASDVDTFETMSNRVGTRAKWGLLLLFTVQLSTFTLDYCLILLRLHLDSPSFFGYALYAPSSLWQMDWNCRNALNYGLLWQSANGFAICPLESGLIRLTCGPVINMM